MGTNHPVFNEILLNHSRTQCEQRGTQNHQDLVNLEGEPEFENRRYFIFRKKGKRNTILVNGKGSEMRRKIPGKAKSRMGNARN